MKCGNCQKDFEGQSYKTGTLVDVCYSCFQKEHYKQDSNYQKWQNIKNNLTLFILWVSTGDPKVLQEDDIQKYFSERFYGLKQIGKTYDFNNRKFFEITDYIQLEAFNPSSGKRLKKIDGQPNDVLGFDGSNYYLIKKEEFEELKTSLNK